MKTTKDNTRRDKGIFTGTLLGFLIILLISTCSCRSLNVPSQRVDNLVIQPDTLYMELPKHPEPDKKGKFITRATQIGIVVLSFLTVNGYMK